MQILDRTIYARFCKLARDAGLGFVLESPTWRANIDWAVKLGYSRNALGDANRQAFHRIVRNGRSETPP